MTQRNLDRLYHAIPLHYLPSLFAAGALYSQSVLSGYDLSVRSPQNWGLGGQPSIPGGIRPRSSATRRDRMLGLDHFVHLSPTAKSPLLADKLRRGYPHAVIVFDTAAILDLPETAVLPYNTKAWRTRACYAPVVDRAERTALINRYREGNWLPSLEILVKYGLPLSLFVNIAFVDAHERDIVGVLGLIDIDRLTVEPGLFPAPRDYAPVKWDLLSEYFERCRSAKRALPPPSMPFD